MRTLLGRKLSLAKADCNTLSGNHGAVPETAS